MTAASSTVDGLTTASPVPLTQFESPPPAPLQHTPASLGDHIGIGFKNTVAEASREGGGWEAVKVALRSVWMVLDFSLVGPLSQVPMAVRVLSFYFADKLRGKDNGILRDVSYGEKAHQKMDVYLPQQTENEGKEELLNSAPPPLVMFVHGGSWASGDKWHYALLARRLRAQGAVVAVVGYALYPSQTFEGMCEDVNTAFDFAISPEGAAKYGADPERVVLCAHSSGAHIASLAMLSRADRFLLARGGGEQEGGGHEGGAEGGGARASGQGGGGGGAGVQALPVKMVLASGVFDIPRHYLHEKGRGVHLFSPMHVAAGSTIEAMNSYSPPYLVRPDHASLFPPVLFLHSKADTTVPFDSSQRMCNALTAVGVQGCAVFDLGTDAGHNDFLVDAMLDKETEGARLFVRESTRTDPEHSS